MLTVRTAYYNCLTWNVRKLIFPQFQRTSITNRFLRFFDHFTASYNCITWNVRKLISPPFQSTSITNRCFLTLFDHFTANYNCMTWNVTKLMYSVPFQCTSITNRDLRLFDRFTAFYNCMTWIVRKLISQPFQCTSITNRVLRLFDQFYTAYYNMYDLKCQKTHISATSVHKYHNVVFLAYLTVLRLFTTCMNWNCQKTHISAIWVNNYFKSWSSLKYLTVLRLITTVWPEIVRKLTSPPFKCTSITNRVLRLFDRFTVYYNCMTWNVRKLISPPFQCTRITNRVHSLFDRFTAYYNIMTWKCQKTHISAFSLHKYHKSCFLAYLTVLRLFTTVWLEMSENSYLRHFSAQVSQIVFLRLFDRLTPYYNCMTWNVRKLISPPFQCTIITNRDLSLFDRFTAYYNMYDLKCQKSHISATSVHKYHKSCS